MPNFVNFSKLRRTTTGELGAHGAPWGPMGAPMGPHGAPRGPKGPQGAPWAVHIGPPRRCGAALKGRLHWSMVSMVGVHGVRGVHGVYGVNLVSMVSMA